MNVTVEEINGRLTIERSVRTVKKQDDKLIKIKKPDSEKTIRGRISSVDNCNVVYINGYYHGSEISGVDGEDIYYIDNNIVGLYAEEMQKISNRIILVVKGGGEIEISGSFAGAKELNE